MKRLFYTLLALTLTALLCLVFTSCGDECSHEWGEWQMLDEDLNSCEDGGEQYRVCAHNEEHVEYRTVEPKDHNYEGEYHALKGGHYQYCTNDGCDKRDVVPHVSGGEATHESAEYCTVCGYEMTPVLQTLDKQKVLIMGNSHVFYGKVVMEKATTVRSQSYRSNDRGYFYRMCRANGRDVEVTNWTFGGHTIKSLMADECTIDRDGCRDGGVCHRTDLKDAYFDYVIICFGVGTVEENNIDETVKTVVDFFRSYNPNVKFVISGNLRTCYTGRDDWSTYMGIPKKYRELEDMGMVIADWGGMIKDVLEGKAEVEGATLDMIPSTFLAKDGYHPSPLMGYIQALMLYSAITGEKAEGQAYDFCTDTAYSYNVKGWVNSKGWEGTNLLEVFASEEDMLALQRLIDKYLELKPYRSLSDEE